MTDTTSTTQRGTFEVFDAATPSHPMQALAETLKRASQGRYNAIAVAHREAVECLARLHVPSISVTPDPEEFGAVADFAMRWAAIGDRVLKAIGEEVKANAVENINLSLFENQFVGAVDGNLTWECEKACEAMRAEWDEMQGGDPDYEYDNRV